MTRRYFSLEFKVEAASTVLDNGLSIREACDAFDAGGSIMRRWVKQLRQNSDGGLHTGSRPLTPEQCRIQELEARVRQLEQEKEILKKSNGLLHSGASWQTTVHEMKKAYTVTQVCRVLEE